MMRGRVQDPRLLARRALLSVLTALTTAAAACDATSPRRDSFTSSNRRPNVLVIVTDDQRVGTLGTMLETREWMVDGGTSYTNAFVTTPLCCPARTSIMTGRFAHNHGVKTNPDGYLIDEHTTLQRYLQAGGYRTGLIGKFLSGWKLNKDPAYFDEWRIMSLEKRSRYYGARWNLDGKIMRVHRYATDFVASSALHFMRRGDREDDDRPWYLYLAPPAGHAPRVPEPAYEDMPVTPWNGSPATRERDRSDKPAYVRRSSTRRASVPKVRAGLIRTLASVDDMVGALLRELRDLGELDDTLIFFTSDNGFLWGEHGMPLNFMAKSNPYEFSIRVPLLVRWPGHFAAGMRNDRLATNADIAPTVLDAAGMRPDDSTQMDGKSLLRDWDRDAVLTEYWTSNESPIPEWAALWDGSFHFVEYYGDAGKVIFREYYDLESDPFELDNLLEGPPSANRPDVRSLSSRLASYRKCKGATCP